MRKVEQAIKEEIQAIRDKVGPELARLEFLEGLTVAMKESVNGSKASKASKPRRKENRPGLGEMPSNGAVGKPEDHLKVQEYLMRNPDATRTALEKATGIKGEMSTVLAELVKSKRVEQTNLPAQRGTKWSLVSEEARIHVGEGVI